MEPIDSQTENMSGDTALKNLINILRADDKPKDPVTVFIQEVRNRTQISHGASGGNKLVHLAHWFEVCAIEHESRIHK